MFIGEAPGQFEDYFGVPFVGRSGNLLNMMLGYVPHQFQYIITNIVCCRPMDLVLLDNKVSQEDVTSSLADTDTMSHDELVEHIDTLTEGEDYEISGMNRTPTKAEADACRPHIEELREDFKPHGIVHLGNTARDFYPSPSIPSIALIHPAAILRDEYKLITVLRQARKLELFVERLSHARTDSGKS